MIVDEKGIKDTWKEYMEKLMNEENEWDHRIPAGVKEGPADCIKTSEVTAGLKNIRLHACQCCCRNDTSHRGHWNSVDIGLT